MNASFTPDLAPWSGRVFCGRWVESVGGAADIVEPATGRTLGRIGIAAVEDVDRAAGHAAGIGRAHV